MTMTQSNKDGLVLPPLANNNSANNNNNNNNSDEDNAIIPQQHLNRSDTISTTENNQSSNNDPQFTDEEDEIEQDTLNSNITINNINNNINHDSIREEIVHEGTNTWLPIHFIRKTKAKFWTHYLALDKTLTIVRCKHCGGILEKFTNNFDSTSTNESLENTKKFQRHLKQKHNLNPLISYYKNNEDTTLLQSNNNNNNKHNNKFQPSHSARSILVAQHYQKDINFTDLNAQQRQILYPFSKLMAIIIASQNLSMSFIMDPAMKLLYSKLSQPFIPDPSSVKSTIKTISKQINDIIKRTAQRNDLDLQLIIDVDHLPMDLNDRTEALTERLKFFLNEILKITLFSITSSVWSNKLNQGQNSTNVLALNFLDQSKDIIKTIPLNVKVSESSLLNTVTIRNQLLDVLTNIKGLNKSVLSMTISHPRLINMTNIDSTDFFHMNQSPYHNCIVDILADIVKPIFGTSNLNDSDTLLDPTQSIVRSNSNNLDNNCYKPKDFYSNNPEHHLLDSVVNLNDINILNNSQSIFHRIKNFYNEIQSNPWQLERFNQSYKDKFHENNGPILQTFDPQFYSTAETTLYVFLKSKSIIKETQKNLQGEIFEESDFKLISIIYDFIKSINKIIIYYTSTKKMNFTYIFFTIIMLEKELNDMIKNCKFQPLEKTLLEIQSIVRNYKNILIKDDTILLALFSCPATLFEREILEYVFHTVSLSEIVNIIGSTVTDIIKRFINIEFVTNQHSTDDPNHQFFNGNENKIIKDEIDIILTQIVSEDLYDYLSTANTIIPLSYQSYCEQSNYFREDGRFKRRRQTSDEYVEQTDIMENDNNDEGIPMNYLEQLLDIHIPVCNAFWEQYLANEAGLIIKLLSKIMITESASSKKLEYEFLNNFIPKLGEEYLEDIVKIKLFNEQYSAGKVDYDIDTLATAAQYD